MLAEIRIEALGAISAATAEFDALNELLHRHKRNEARRLIESFPYQKASIIPYVKTKGSSHTLIWEPSTHVDLVQDLKDHFEQMEKMKHVLLPVALETLKKLEDATASIPRRVIRDTEKKKR